MLSVVLTASPWLFGHNEIARPKQFYNVIGEVGVSSSDPRRAILTTHAGFVDVHANSLRFPYLIDSYSGSSSARLDGMGQTIRNLDTALDVELRRLVVKLFTDVQRWRSFKEWALPDGSLVHPDMTYDEALSALRTASGILDPAAHPIRVQRALRQLAERPLDVESYSDADRAALSVGNVPHDDDLVRRLRHLGWITSDDVVLGVGRSWARGTLMKPRTAEERIAQLLDHCKNVSSMTSGQIRQMLQP